MVWYTNIIENYTVKGLVKTARGAVAVRRGYLRVAKVVAYTLHGWVVALAYAAADVGTYRAQKCSMRLNDGLSSQFLIFWSLIPNFWGLGPK